MNRMPANSSSQYVINAIKYIQFNYSHDISIDDIAKAVGVSRSHLYRVFMSNVGQSPIDYLDQLPHQRGMFPFKEFQLSIAEIAVSVGFFDQFYFSRVFKKSKGVPPSKIPDQHQPGKSRALARLPRYFQSGMPAAFFVRRTAHMPLVNADHPPYHRRTVQRRQRRRPC